VSRLENLRLVDSSGIALAKGNGPDGKWARTVSKHAYELDTQSVQLELSALYVPAAAFVDFGAVQDLSKFISYSGSWTLLGNSECATQGVLFGLSWSELELMRKAWTRFGSFCSLTNMSHHTKYLLAPARS
jgi:hypothetical protein